MTDVAAAYDNYGGLAPRPIPRMSATDSRARLAAGVFAAGSMEPKVESAVEFVEATGRRAVITTLGALAPALAGRAGTTIDRASG
jgi:carbamate kinase